MSFWRDLFHSGLLSLVLVAAAHPVLSDSSSPELASYYERHMAIIGGAAYGWTGSEPPRRMLEGAKQVGVSRDSYFCLRLDDTLLRWNNDPQKSTTVMTGITTFAAGQTGVFAIDTGNVLWHVGRDTKPVRIAESIVAASIGDGADYYVRADGALFVGGQAHRGQYGNGKLQALPGFNQVASDAVAIGAHTGHAIYLARNGDLLGTGGNIYGPLSHHGLGDKAIEWGIIFSGARAVATGASHSAALRADGSLWIWGAGYGPTPRRVLGEIDAVAAGSSITLARDVRGALWQLEPDKAPRRLLPAMP